MEHKKETDPEHVAIAMAPVVKLKLSSSSHGEEEEVIVVVLLLLVICSIDSSLKLFMITSF